MADLESLSDGEYTAVVDRIEDGLATVFVESDGTDVGDTVVDATTLPDAGREADAIFRVQVRDGTIVDWAYDPERTTKRATDAQDRFDRLSSRPSSDDDS